MMDGIHGEGRVEFLPPNPKIVPILRRLSELGVELETTTTYGKYKFGYEWTKAFLGDLKIHNYGDSVRFFVGEVIYEIRTEEEFDEIEEILRDAILVGKLKMI